MSTVGGILGVLSLLGSIGCIAWALLAAGARGGSLVDELLRGGEATQGLVWGIVLGVAAILLLSASNRAANRVKAERETEPKEHATDGVE